MAATVVLTIPGVEVLFTGVMLSGAAGVFTHPAKSILNSKTRPRPIIRDLFDIDKDVLNYPDLKLSGFLIARDQENFINFKK